MSTAIVPARVAQILPLEVFSIERGGRNTVAGVNGRVASDIELLELDEELRIARYELRVANDSPSMLTCYAYAVRGKSGQRPVTCTSIAVLPHSGVAVTFELPLPYVGTYDRITVEMHGDGIDVSSDTIPPGRDEKVLIRRACALAAAVITTLILAVAGVAQPQILAVSAPSEALGGSKIHLNYEARGLGNISYDMIGPDGASIDRGNAHSGLGDVALPLPPVASSRTFIARMEAHNIFGGDTKTAVIRDLATPVPLIYRIVTHPASISSLTLPRTSVHSGEALRINTEFAADHGTIRLLDDAETVWAALNIAKSGEAVLKAPHVDHSENLRVALHVERGATSADSEIGVQVVPATPTPQLFKPINGAPMVIADGPYTAGAVVALKVTRPVSDLHISLQDSFGAEVEAFNVDGNQAELHIPQHLSGPKYTAVITFADRNGQETIVYPLAISTHAKT